MDRKFTGIGVRVVALLFLGTLFWGCELGVTNPNEPDRERALATDSDVEALIVSAFNAAWDVSQSNLSGVLDRCGGTAWMAMLSAMANQTASSWTNWGHDAHTREPRPPYINDKSTDFSCGAATAWFRSYQGLAAAASGLRAIDEGLEIGPGGQNTARARAWGKFSQGLLHGNLALLFDKAFIVDETTELVDEQGNAIVPDFSTYQEVQAAATGYLQEAIAIADANQFTTESSWLNGVQLTSADFVALVHSYIGRFEARTPRNPAEAEAKDWNFILSQLQQGHDFDFVVQGNFTNFWTGLKRWTSAPLSPTTHLALMNYHAIGPADQSGAFQNWISSPLDQREVFDIITPDARIPQPVPEAVNGCTDGVDTPQCAGPPLLIGYHSNGIMPQPRGVYRRSRYTSYQQLYGDLCNHLGPGITYDGTICEYTQLDKDFLMAEALWRTGNAGASLAIINGVRAEFGGLPPATEAGVVGQAECVPRKPDGTCGDFWDVLAYEKQVSVLGEHSGDIFADKRRWGRLVPGTWLHLPVPVDELETLQMAVYTCPGAACGGPGMGAAPAVIPGDLNSALARAKWDLEAIRAFEERRPFPAPGQERPR